MFWSCQPEGGPGPADEEDSGHGRKSRQNGRCADEAHRGGEEETLVCGIVATKKREEPGHAEASPLPHRWGHRLAQHRVLEQVLDLEQVLPWDLEQVLPRDQAGAAAVSPAAEQSRCDKCDGWLPPDSR